jgi:dipeptidyl aminopeptidase/acylaminoacyl peptidase
MIDDFTSGIKHLVEEGIADPERVGIFGHSNGGWVVNYLITETDVAKCAVVWSGSSSVAYQEYSVPAWAHEITNGNIYDNFDDYVKMSPLFRMNKVRTPLLMVIGDRDWDIWLPEMLMQFSALRQLGKDVTLVRYANEGHVFRELDDIRDFRARVDGFFDRHLLAGH